MKLTKTISACLAAVGVMLTGSISQAAPTISNLSPNGAFQFQSSGTLGFTLASTPGVTNVSVQLTGTPLTGGGSAVLSYLTIGNGLTAVGSANSETISATLSSNVIYSAVIKASDAAGTTSQAFNFDTIQPIYTWEAEDYDYSNGLFVLDRQIIGGVPSQTNAYRNFGATLNVDYSHNSAGGGAYRPAPPAGLNTENASDTARVQYANGQADYDIGNNNGGDFGNYTRVYPAGTYRLFLRGSNGGGSNPQNDAASLSVLHGNATLNGSGPYQFTIPNGGWQNWHWVPLVDSSSGQPTTVTFDGLTNTLNVHIDGGNCNQNFYMLVATNANLSVSSSVTLTSIYPDGNNQFEQTNKLSFTANSGVGINPNSILVQLTGTTLAGQSSSAVYTTLNGLVATGSANSWNVSFGSLSNDMTYTAFIQVGDLNGGVTSTTVSFDTVSPSYYTFEAEDWNFNGGYIDNPQTNLYYGNDGVSGVDFFYNGTGSSGGYSRVGLTLGGSGDKSRTAYAGTGYTDYAIQNVNGGDWANYTRTFPSGQYNIYLRAANGNGNNSDSASLYAVTSDPTQPNQTASKLGTFAVPSTGGWSTYQWIPLLNSAGNLVVFTGGAVETLRGRTDNGSYNGNYYMLVPADTSVHTPPFVSNVYPDGTALFQLTNTLTFTANSAAGIAHSGVTVVLNGINVSSSLTFSGAPSALNVSYPLRSNILNSVVITLTDSYGTTSSTNTFDTLDPNCYQFEAEDYDFTTNGLPGQFIDGQLNAYRGFGSTENVDEHDSGNGGDSYRPSGGSTPGLEVENPAADIVRPAFSAGGYTDYNIGFNNGGNWANYTHTYPAGTYNVYMRSANPNSPPGIQVNAATLSLVTGGWGTTSQATTQIGSFNVPFSGGWHSFAWAPLLDTGGNLARVTLNGSTNTLKISVAGGNYNVNFYALVPADTSAPVISGISPDGTSLFQSSNALNFVVSSSAGISTNSVTVTLNGITVSNLVFTGSSTSWHVSYPSLPANGLYTAVISATTLNGQSISATTSFDTYSANNYQLEAEDYDYTSNGISGLFFDNPQVNAYTNLPGLTTVDLFESDVNGPGRGNSYRPAGNSDFPDTAAGDKARAQFTAGKTDYSLGSFGAGSWANYTRHYPPGTYNVVGRFAEGAGTSQFGLSQLTSGHGTTNQTTTPLGSFTIPNQGWGTWEYATLLDGNGNPAKVTLDGSQITLQLVGQNSNEANVNFLMLTPTTPSPTLKAKTSNGNVNLWFFAQTGYNYQIQYKTNLLDSTWINLGGPVVGNNTNNVVSDPTTGTTRFYRIHP